MKQKRSNQQTKFEFPVIGYMGYIVTKFFDLIRPLSILLDKLETLRLRDDIRKLSIDRPIYITGLARAGTTIVLEMLSKHQDLASHRYKHIIVPYLPYLSNMISKKINVYSQPTERIHKDGIFITRDSPEAIEEMLWQKFFNNIHDENTSNIFDENISNPKFEKFYRNHIRKLMISQKSSRYLTKNNYNVTRMEYLLNLFPNSKFLVIIRNPVNQIASLIKQTKLFIKMEQRDPIIHDWSRLIGHREFGKYRVCINVGNSELIQEIRKLWGSKETYLKGWALYWSSIYDFIANRLEENEKLRNATLIVRYEDLCENPEKIIDDILKHTELDSTKFEKVKNYYIRHLHQPTYYKPSFSKQEINDITEITNLTTTRFGYIFHETKSLYKS